MEMPRGNHEKEKTSLYGNFRDINHKRRVDE